MSKILDLMFGLTGNASEKTVTAQVTPSLDDNSKLLATTEFLRQQFTGTGKHSIAGNGYQKLPGGLIIQWGTSANIVGGASENIVFPIPMPTAVLQVLLSTQSLVNSTTPIVGGWQLDAGSSLAQFTLRNISTGTAQFSWLAIGY